MPEAPQTIRKAHWVCAGESVRGVAHKQKGAPNQDAVRVAAFDDAAFVAVADGHGGSPHFRSDVGAQAAVDAAIDSLARLGGVDSVGREVAFRGLGPSILHAWQTAIEKHFAGHPFTESELNRPEARQLRDNPLLAYGCTVLAAGHVQSCLVYVQLGDGDILLVASDGKTTRAFPRDERFAAGQTVSLCQTNAADEFRVQWEPDAAVTPALVLLSTDGYANAFRTDGDFLKIGKDYLALLGRDGLEAVSRQLPAFLNHASEAGSADDISLALLVNVDVVPKIGAEHPVEVSFLDSYSRGSGSSRGLNMAVFLGCLFGLVLLAAVLILWRGGGRA
jgi:hypothetical protein